jgi:hypothetical protein
MLYAIKYEETCNGKIKFSEWLPLQFLSDWHQIRQKIKRIEGQMCTVLQRKVLNHAI